MQIYTPSLLRCILASISPARRAAPTRGTTIGSGSLVERQAAIEVGLPPHILRPIPTPPTPPHHPIGRGKRRSTQLPTRGFVGAPDGTKPRQPNGNKQSESPRNSSRRGSPPEEATNLSRPRLGGVCAASGACPRSPASGIVGVGLRGRAALARSGSGSRTHVLAICLSKLQSLLETPPKRCLCSHGDLRLQIAFSLLESR
jgi:hypothetical protein